MEIDIVGLSIKLASLVLFAFLGTWAFVAKRRPLWRTRGGWHSSTAVGVLCSFIAIGNLVGAVADVLPLKGPRLVLRAVSAGLFVAGIVVALVMERRASRRPAGAVQQ